MSTFAAQENATDESPLLSNSPNAGLLSQRKCAFGLPKPSLTSEYEGKTRLQAKLTIGASNDPLEQEADRVADQVLAAPAHSSVSGAAPSIQRFTGQSTGDAGAAPASVDRVLSGSGRPLDSAIQQDMGQRFGHDFSQVQVYTGSVAEQSAQDINAHAYTVGHNIVFGAGGFAPGSHEGRKLIAHELTHVVQQSGTLRCTVQRAGGQSSMTAEIEMPLTYVGTVPNAEPAEQARIRRRRERTLRFFAKVKDYQLQEAYVSRLQRYLDEGMEENTYWDVEMIEHIIQERAPNAPWHDAELRSFLARRKAKQLSQARENQLPTLPSYWQSQFGALAEQTKGWPEDVSAYARRMLWKWHQSVAKFDNNPYFRDVALARPASDLVFNDIVKQYELVLRERDRSIQKECKGRNRDWLMNVWGDPCKPWFEGTSQRGEQELHQLQMRMRIFADEQGVPYRNIVFWLKEYMRQVNALPTQMGEAHLEILGAWATVQGAMVMASKPVGKPAALPKSSRFGSVVRKGAQVAQAGADVAAMFYPDFNIPRIGHLAASSKAPGSYSPRSPKVATQGQPVPTRRWWPARQLRNLYAAAYTTFADVIPSQTDIAGGRLPGRSVPALVHKPATSQSGASMSAPHAVAPPVATTAAPITAAPSVAVASPAISATAPTTAAASAATVIAPHATSLAPVTGAVEVNVSHAQYEAGLGHIFPSHSLDSISSLADSVGQQAAQVALANPMFIAAVQNGNMTLAGTLFHSAAAAVARALPASAVPAGWTIHAEFTIQTGRGGSRADILMRGPNGEVIEFDWKTSGKSATKSHAQMQRHAGQITTNIGGTLTRQESRSWIDFVRPLYPNAPWPNR